MPAIDAVGRSWRARVACAIACIAVCVLHAGTAAAADAALHRFHVDGGDLGDTLNAVAAQAGVQILYDASLVAGRHAKAIDGEFSVDDALARVLAGSGLAAVAATRDAYVLKRRLPPKRAPPPPEAVVDAPAPAPTTTELASIFVHGPGPQRAAAESALSISVIDREQIDASGYTTLFDLLRAQPGIDVANQPEAMTSASGSAFKTGAAGAAAVALRRLGAKNTLILVDGRRITGYGISELDTASVPDLTSIPLAIVERVEILRDGASVVYGSDAVAGVINIILRRDFSGSAVEAYTGVSGRGDTASSRASYRWSTNTDDGTSAFVSLDLAHVDPLVGDERSWYTLDQSSHGLADLRSPASYPGNLIYGSQYVARAGCAPADLSPDGVCLLDSAKFTTLQTAKSAESIFARITHPLGDDILLHADLRAANVRQKQQAAPSTSQIANPSPAPGEADSLVYSFNDLGPVEETTRSTLASLTAGATGHTGRWSWDADARFEVNRVHDAIDHLILATPRDGMPVFDFSHPSIDPDSAAIAAPEVVRRGESTLDALNADVSGPLVDLPGGAPAALTGGFELRREGIELKPDALLQQSALANQAPEVPVSAYRPAAAVYAKADFPLTASFDAYAAGRFDKTRGFDSRLSPAVGLSWNALPSVTLRATRYAGYRAPALSELHRFGGSLSTAVPQTYYIPRDLGPCAIVTAETPDQLGCSLYTTSTSNPNLDAETSYTNAIGLDWFPSPSFSFDVDVYDTLRNNEIAELPLEYALEHPDLFPGFLSRNASGELVAINEMLVNLGHTRTRGVDLQAHWDIEAPNAGRFKIGFGLNYLGDLEREVTPGSEALQSAGFRSEPRVTAVTSLRWATGPWIAGANLRYTGNYAYEEYAGAADSCPAYKATLGKCRTPSFTLVNLSLTYQGLPHWSFSGYVNNVFDHEPRYYDEASGGYNAAFDDPVGRYFAVRATYAF